MADQESLLTIGAFARLVGLSSSALRFYDDCGLLQPYDVDPASGYRYYSAGQERRAATISRLRGIGLPLQDIRTVLDGPPEQARAALRSYVERTGDLARTAHEVAEDVIATLPDRSDEAQPTTVVIPGPELASALRQVAPATAATADIPALQGVLLRAADAELTVVATDRYWMAVRTLPIEAISGADRQVIVAAQATPQIVAFAAGHDRVRLRIEDTVARLEGDDDVLDMSAIEGQFPSYQSVLSALPAAAGRVTVDRLRLIEVLLANDDADVIVLTTGDRRLDVRVDGDRHGVRLPAITTGEPLATAFRPQLLLGALDVSVGPEVLLQFPAREGSPVVVRSADQGTFTTVVMPVRRDDRA
ncbi:MerR family transcriptional regulator [Flexivirga caeni]|uniref:MerR family transcriptional regulator n=1 Tax=Flexivirga caeni TaxID=2294115 RepID=A0A3M9MJ44_9MICO|nr:MerR family transcriptional regulator [Flexivirga caeni]RNI24873.1 MerR family transcriptional regulator [Flexivirga caeni]